ncbi:MAG TPA: hypothetical protein VFS23_24945 [Vicinamibacterales bacterium]|nr:hypothetical protein [Vicinamibacterales bacterium]
MRLAALRHRAPSSFEVWRVDRFDSTAIGFHAQVVGQFTGSGLAVSVSSEIDGNPFLLDQTGQVNGL